MSGFIVTYSQQPDTQGRKEPSALLWWVTANGRTGKSRMCVCGYCQTLSQHGSCCQCRLLSRTFVNPQPWGLCSRKGASNRSQQETSVPKSCCTQREGRENLGMLISLPLGRYLLGKCLTFICTSAVNKEAFTFSPAQQSRRVGGFCSQTTRGAGGAQPAPGILGQAWKKTAEMTKVQVEGEPGGSWEDL